jgi:4-amino-4-deoxy-L-arabinose transferase-like glycosyltransferase
VPLLFVLAVALAFRLYRLDIPYLDAHSWRQVTNADIARIWTEQPIDFFYPSVSWGGPDGRVGMEFPLLQLITALTWRAIGVDDSAGRLVAVAFSLAAVVMMYLLGRRLFDRPTGLAAAFLMAVSPSLVYFGRTLLSDIPMLFFSIAAVWGYAAYAQSGRWTHGLAGTAALALAGLVKIPAILVLGPIGWIGLTSRGWAVVRDRWFTLGPLAAVVVMAAWYFHADRIYLETGLTQAVFRPSGTYPADVAVGAGAFATVSHWTRPGQLSWTTASELANRFWILHLTPIFAIAVLLGAVRFWRPRGRSVVDVWMLAALALIFVSLNGQLPHEFHQLPALPPLALYFGMAARPCFDARTFARLGDYKAAGTILMGSCLVGLAYLGFMQSPAIRFLYRPDFISTWVLNAGWAIDELTPKNALLVTTEYDRYGSNSPMLLYFSHRRGWSFDAQAISPEVIEHLKRTRGACYFATSMWSTLTRVQPRVDEYLKGQTPVPLPHTHWEFQLFDLGCGKR